MIRKYLLTTIALGFLTASGLVSAQGTPASTTPTTASVPAKTTTTKVKHHHKHAKSKVSTSKTETPKQ